MPQARTTFWSVSREITATLDLDKVMQKIVNATAAIATYDQCAIAILDHGKLKLGAVSGVMKLDRGDPKLKATEDILEWVYFGGANLTVTQDPDGKIHADRTETEEKFRSLFSETGLKAYYATTLKDDEGKLGVLAFECREPIVFDEVKYEGDVPQRASFALQERQGLGELARELRPEPRRSAGDQRVTAFEFHLML